MMKFEIRSEANSPATAASADLHLRKTKFCCQIRNNKYETCSTYFERQVLYCFMASRMSLFD